MVYQSPRPGPEAVSQLYQGGSYHSVRGGVPEHYVRYSLRRSDAALAWGLGVLGADGGSGRALDIGCGIGGAAGQPPRARMGRGRRRARSGVG